jgi:DNA-binding SARP family transcriptional activator
MPYTTGVEFRMLGPVGVRHGGRPVALGGGRERYLLAMLLLNADRCTDADRLVELLWDVPPASARAQLDTLVYRLRRRLPVSGLIASRPDGYELRLCAHRLDLVWFRRLVEQGRRLTESGEHRQAAASLSQAVGMWRGPALADVPHRLFTGPRKALHEEWLAAVEARLAAELALGHHHVVLRELPALLAEHPYRERLYELRMSALVAAGRRVDALATYQTAYQRFMKDVGLLPGWKLRNLERRILASADRDK